ncbi:MAG: FKBP-type peptidyl-prolyl cis-trans isomerase, partial [Polyangiales bacterium]
MKNVWTLLSCVALAASLTACKKSEPAPAEAETDEKTEAPAEEAEAAAQKVVAQGAAPDSIPAPPDVAAPPENAERSDSGLAWTVLEKGTGDKNPGPADIVTVNYTGWTTSGRMFDSSVKRGK